MRTIPLLLSTLLLPLAAQVAAQDDASAVDAIFADWTGTHTPGCVVGVARAGEVLHRRGYGMASLEHAVPMSPGVVSEIGSVSKQFTAAAVLLLERDGLLSLDDDVREHIPELGIEQPLTLRRLADHTSGIRDWIGLMGLAGRPWGEVIHTVPEIVELVSRQRTLNFPPGSRYLYSNTGYTLLLEVVRRVSGMSFPEFTTERIFRPLGMEDTEWRDDHARVVPGRAAAHRPDGDGFRTMMPFSDAIGSGGLITSVDDMLTWTEALHRGGFGGAGFLEDMTRVGVLDDGREIDYALGLTVTRHRGVPEISHGGATAGYRAYLAYYPEDRLTVALQCNVTAVNSARLARSAAEVFLGDRVGPEPAPARIDVQPVPRERLQALAGLYRDPATERILRIEVEDDLLRTSGAFTTRLIPVGESRFRRADTSEEYVIERVPPGGVEIREEVDEADPVGFVAVTEVDPGPAELDEYVGRYRSDELGIDYTVVRDGRTLAVRRPVVSDWRLSPTFRDAFSVEEGGSGSVVFQRDADGAVRGFGYYAGRILDVRFERVGADGDTIRAAEARLREVRTEAAPRAIGPYSQAIVADGLVFAAGQIALDPGTGSMVGVDAATQTERVLENLAAVLEAAGSGLDLVVRTTVYLADLDDFAAMNEVYRHHFGTHAPARSTIQAARLPMDALVEIDAVAVLRETVSR